MNHRYNNALNQRYNKVVKGNNAQWGMTDDKKLDSKGKGDCKQASNSKRKIEDRG